MAFGVHRDAVDPVFPDPARAPAHQTQGWKFGTVGHAKDGHQMFAVIADHDLLAQAATGGPRPAGIGQQKLLLDRGRGQGLPNLHRHHGHIRWSRRRLRPVPARERAEATGGKIDRGDIMAIPVPALKGHQIHHAAVRLDAVGNCFSQGAEHQGGDEMTDHVPGPGGGGRLGVQQAARGRCYGDGHHAAAVVG